MNENLINEVRNGIKHWYIPVIAGIIFLGAGIYTIFQPLESYEALAIMFGVVFLASGFSEILMSFTSRAINKNWILVLFLGFIDTIIGFMLVSNIGLSMEILPWFVGIVILIRSINSISYYSELNAKKVPGAANLLIIGILGVIFAMLIMFSPGFGGLTIIVWTAMAFILLGIYGIFLGFKLKQLN